MTAEASEPPLALRLSKGEPSSGREKSQSRTPDPEAKDRAISERHSLREPQDERRHGTPLLALLQLGDSLFPSGAFTQSYGLEQLAREGRLKTPMEVEAFVVSVLHNVLATADALTCYRAAVAATNDDLAALLDADRAFYRTKTAEELRDAALSTGRRQLEEVNAVTSHPVLQLYAAEVRRDRTLGTQPSVFGAVCAAHGIDARSAVAALLFGAVNGMLQASMRLLPVSHRDVQAALTRLRPEIEAVVAFTSSDQPLRAFHPLQDIASMRHAGARARLFAS